MLTYFFSPVSGFDGFRIFNISDDTNGQFYSQTLPCNYSSLAQNHLNIQASPLGSSPEECITLEDSSGNLIPFQYHLSAASQHGAIDLYYNTIKRPLMVGGPGLFYIGPSGGYTYYYSQTMVALAGNLTFNNITEPVSGTAWIDKQYGDFVHPGEKGYEWFCLQLSNGMDLSFWTMFNEQNQIPDTSTYKLCNIYINDSTYTIATDFELKRLQYSFTPDSVMCYSQQWRLVLPNIDLTITTQHLNCEVTAPNSQRFYEGSATVQGVINNEQVTGRGFAELFHSYDNPNVKLISPNGGEIWDGSQPVTWQLLNPEGGRPLYYDLELSIDDGITFLPIVQGLTDTSYNWDISGLTTGTECWLRVIGYSIDTTLVGMDNSDNSFIIGGVNSSEFDTPILRKYDLIQNYPNPFNPITNIEFVLPKTSQVLLKIFNTVSEEVAVIVSEKLNAGIHKYNWNASNLSSGVYYYRLETEEFVETKKMILIR